MNHKVFTLFFILCVSCSYLLADDFTCKNPEESFSEGDVTWFRGRILTQKNISELSWHNFMLCGGNINLVNTFRAPNASRENPFTLTSLSQFMAAILANDVTLTTKFLSGELWTQQELDEHAKNLIPDLDQKVHSNTFRTKLSPLQLAILLGHKEIIELLIDYGANNLETLTITNSDTELKLSAKDLIKNNWKTLYNNINKMFGFPGADLGSDDWKNDSKESQAKQNEILFLLNNKKKSKVIGSQAKKVSQNAVDTFAVALRSLSF